MSDFRSASRMALLKAECRRVMKIQNKSLLDEFALLAFHAAMTDKDFDQCVQIEDLVEHPEGKWVIRPGNPTYATTRQTYDENLPRYAVAATYEQRLARHCYRLAKAMVQERENLLNK